MVWAESWIALLGLALLAVAAWSWAGSTPGSRWWIRVWQGDTMALGFAPGVGLILLGLGLIALVPGDGSESGLGMVGSLLWVVGFPVFVIGSWGPRWWGPRWYRSMTPRDRVAALRGPAGSVARSATGHDSEEALRDWPAGWVRDSDTVRGRLTLDNAGVRFAASGTGGRAPAAQAGCPVVGPRRRHRRTGRDTRAGSPGRRDPVGQPRVRGRDDQRVGRRRRHPRPAGGHRRWLSRRPATGTSAATATRAA